MEIIQTIGRLAATQGVWDLKARPQLTEPAHRGKFFVSSLQAIRVMGGGDLASTSGVFTRGTQGGSTCKFEMIRDGLSSTIFVGETLYDCHDHREGLWSFNGFNNAHGSTVVPINNMTTCHNSQAEAQAKGSTHPQCFNKNNWNFSWGFRSKHSGGSQFLFGDGSTKLLSQEIEHTLYQKLGGKADGNAVGSF